jgi:hypothetical protein
MNRGAGDGAVQKKLKKQSVLPSSSLGCDAGLCGRDNLAKAEEDK